MMNLPLGVVVEGSVAVLLLVTIGYCMILNRRLKKLHADRETLRKMVLDLVKATDLANAAIRELKATALEADTTINARLEEAEKFDIDLRSQLASGKELIERIAKITSAAKVAVQQQPKPDDPRSSGERVQSALQQLAMRPRMRGNAA
jgi:hypothetical protein